MTQLRLPCCFDFALYLLIGFSAPLLFIERELTNHVNVLDDSEAAPLAELCRLQFQQGFSSVALALDTAAEVSHELEDDFNQGADALELEHRVDSVQVELNESPKQVLEPTLLDEHVFPGMLPVVRLLGLLIHTHRLILVWFIVLLLELLGRQ